jgi:hypothetical protein
MSFVMCSSAILNGRDASPAAAYTRGGGEWKKAEAVLQSREARYQEEQQAGKLTQKGKALVPLFKSDDTGKVFDSPDDFDAWDRCITRGLPSSMLPYNYNNGIQILQAPGCVVINLEMVHEARIVPVEGRPPLASAIKQWMGESRGHWEGATLVVETTNFNGRVHMLITGIPGTPPGDWPSSPEMKLTERFTRVSDKQIDFEMTVEDPDVLTDKWTVSYPMYQDPQYFWAEYACHEGNTAVRNFIETSRFERGLNPDGSPRKK